MAKIAGSKCKLCRREGMKLYLKGDRCNTAKCAVVKRNYAPGLHGQKLAGSRITDYGRQLREKQRAKRIYNLSEKQFKIYFDKAVKKKEETGQAFITMLEMRFDRVIYKSGFAKSIHQARQLVGHGHFLVNKKKVNIPSYQLKVNDIITIKESSLKSRAFADLKERMKSREVPQELFYDEKDLSIKVLEIFDITKMGLAFDITSIIEFYSR